MFEFIALAPYIQDGTFASHLNTTTPTTNNLSAGDDTQEAEDDDIVPSYDDGNEDDDDAYDPLNPSVDEDSEKESSSNIESPEEQEKKDESSEIAIKEEEKVKEEESNDQKLEEDKIEDLKTEEETNIKNEQEEVDSEKDKSKDVNVGRTRASFLQFDSKFHILADPGWDGISDLSYLDPFIPLVDLIILSHTTIEHIGAFALLLYKYPLLRKVKIYATLPIAKIGRISTIELYRSCGLIGPLKNAVMEIEDIEEAFNRIQTVNYSQSVQLQGKLSGITITAYNAGHTIGGSFWLLARDTERVIYAPTWNHSKDSFLKASKFITSNLIRPTVLISGSDLGSSMSHKKRIEKFIMLVKLSLFNNTSVVLPTSVGGRLLELLPVINSNISQEIPIVLVSCSGNKSLQFATNMLEWTSPEVIKMWENQNKILFDSSRVKLSTVEGLKDIPGAKIVFVTGGVDMQEGSISRSCFVEMALTGNTVLMMTERPSYNTFGYQLYETWEMSTRASNNLEDGAFVSLDKNFQNIKFVNEVNINNEYDISKYRSIVEERRLQQKKRKDLERKNDVIDDQLLLDIESESDSDNEDIDEDIDEDNLTQSVNSKDSVGNGEIRSENGDKFKNSEVNNDDVEGYTINRLQQEINSAKFGSYSLKDIIKLPMDFDVRNTKGRNKMFPYTYKKSNIDDYGEVINHSDFVKEEENMPILNKVKMNSNGRKNDSNNNNDDDDKDNDDDDEYEYIEVDDNADAFKRRRLNGNVNGEVIIERNNKRYRKVRRKNIGGQEGSIDDDTVYELDALGEPKERVSFDVPLINIRCGLIYLDLEGLADLRSMILTFNALKPRKIIIIPNFSVGYGGDCNKLIQSVSKQHKSILTSEMLYSDTTYNYRNGILGTEYLVANFNKVVNLGNVITSYEIQLNDKLDRSLHWQKITGGFSVAHVVGIVGAKSLTSTDGGEKTVKEITDGENQDTDADKNQDDEDGSEFRKKVYVLEPLDNNATSLNSFNKLAIGDIKLTELRNKLINMKHNAEFKGDGTLVIDGQVAVRKITEGNIVVDGGASKLFYEVRELVQEMLAYV
ncbi:hypothetical protein B5S32_g1367 [[Candida] boidinii]|nr:hypothetical protein B5S32_g1367 [[Candida] boidinii]